MNIQDGKEFDVIVAGAGPAGFCAAVQAGRGGLKVALFEHFAMPGGSLTVLGSNSIDQFNNPHRPAGDRMVITGIGWEFVQELAKRGFAEIPDMDAPYRVHWQYGVKVNPIAAAQCMDDFLLEANVSLYYRQGIVAVETTNTPEGIRLDAVIVSTKAGLVRHRAKIFIDCTGDGDLCAWAGAEVLIGDNLQPGSLRLYPDRNGASQGELQQMDEIWTDRVKQQPGLSDMLFGDMERLFSVGGDNVNHINSLNTADSAGRSEAEIQARRGVVSLLSALKESGIPARILGCAPESAPRESRRILGDRIMTGEDYLAKRVYEDAVCYTYWFIDMHREGQSAEIVYLYDEKTPTISLGALRPRGLKNVFCAGRCISADRACSSAIRVKASCMAMGQAVGAAAVLTIHGGSSDVRSIDASLVRGFLSAHGALVP